MTGPKYPRWRVARRTRQALVLVSLGAATALGGTGCAEVVAAQGTTSTRIEPMPKAALDAALIYQLLIGEIQLTAGDPGTAYEVILDAARRTRDEALFRRATEIALQARAVDQALAAIKAWRSAVPASTEAMRNQAQLLIAMNRPQETVEPLRALIAATPPAQRAALIALVPRFYGRPNDMKAVVGVVEQVVSPWRTQADTRIAAQVAVARAWLFAGEPSTAVELAGRAHALDPKNELPPLLALEAWPGAPAIETIVQSHLAADPQSVAVRLAYSRALTRSQRYGDAIPQLEAVTTVQPALPAPWLTLGALHLELKHPDEATAALKKFLELQATGDAGPGASGIARSNGDAARLDEEGDDNQARATTTAYLMLAQAAEMQKRFDDAEAWLAKIDDTANALEVQTRRASMLARQGKVSEARELIQRTPERLAGDRRAKLLAEAQVLRDVKQWQPAWEVLDEANRQFPNDTDLLYEQAMVAEKLDRLGDMERLLRRVIELKPDHHHAYNALGYSLADRNLRLEEARELIRKALELAPGEPFITDSLGWVEYRLGNREEALRLLREAFRARPDAEIGAHLGEVLWSLGRQDEARQVWQQARQRDDSNEVLHETLKRLKVEP